MKNLTFVTGNQGKYLSIKEYFEKIKIDVDFYFYDAKELDVNDIEKISKKKAIDAYEIIKKPCFVIDTGFYIDNYPNNPGYPGAFVKRSKVSYDIDGLLETMKNVNNRTCRFVDCLTFYDGENFYQFYGESKGTLAKEKRGSWTQKFKSNLWYVFIPDNYSKTLAEMTDYEINNRPDQASAKRQFATWYKEEYLNQKKKKLIK